MGLHHRHQLELLLVQPGDHRRGDRWIHHHGLCATAEHKDIVVVQNRQGRDRNRRRGRGLFKRGHR